MMLTSDDGQPACRSSLTIFAAYCAFSAAVHQRERAGEREDLARELLGGVLVVLAVGAVVGELHVHVVPAQTAEAVDVGGVGLRALRRALEQPRDRPGGARDVAEVDAAGG